MHRLVLSVILAWVLVPCWGQYERLVVKRDFQDYYQSANYDESLVPDYQLPDPLLCVDGTQVTTAEQWENQRRPELVKLLETYMYGRAPKPDSGFGWEVTGTDTQYRGGKATRRDVMLHLTAEGPDVPLCLVVPNDGKADKHPVFVGLSFDANDSIWTEGSRASRSWQPDTLLAHGYGLVTFRYTDAELDKASDHFRSSRLHRHFYQAGQTAPMPDEWGALGCWAWTASRVMDYLEQETLVDAGRVALLGHSRLGKAVLWAGAKDTRFRVIFPVNAGCCGTALSRRCVGETVECVNEFSHQWFCGNFRQFSHREQEMPFDQHEVLALLAPRPVYVASAEDDRWSDPLGEFLGLKGAEPVYALYGQPGIMTGDKAQEQWPAVDCPAASGTLAYHIRKGPHAVLLYDWQQFLRFADRYLK